MFSLQQHCYMETCLCNAFIKYVFNRQHSFSDKDLKAFSEYNHKSVGIRIHQQQYYVYPLHTHWYV